jgi:hypothetical protein
MVNLGEMMTRQGFIVMQEDSIRLMRSGMKTQTRRLMNPQPTDGDPPTWLYHGKSLSLSEAAELSPVYGVVGSRLWVRETHSVDALTAYPCPQCWYKADFDMFCASPNEHIRGCEADKTGVKDGACIACAMNGAKFRWRSPRYMAERLSRFTLLVTDIRVQRLQDITDEDAIFEGCHRRMLGSMATLGYSVAGMERWAYEQNAPPGQCMDTPRLAYANAWNRINGGRRTRKTGMYPWDQNPWVWAISFRSVA